MVGRSTPQIFLADSSAEAGRLLGLLQGKGFTVVDVPLGMLVNRCRYETPQLIICDAEAREAPAHLTKLRQETHQKIPILLLSETPGAVDSDPQLRELAEETLLRPLDLDEAVLLVEKLCGLPARETNRTRRPRTSRAPRLVTAARKPYRSDALLDASPTSSAPPAEPSEPHWPVDSPPSLGPLASELIQGGPDSSGGLYLSRPLYGAAPVASGLSPETTSILEQGRRRLEALPRPVDQPPRRQIEGDGPIQLRQELLDALNESLDDSDVGIPAHPPSSVGMTLGTRTESQAASSPGAAGFQQLRDAPSPSQLALTNSGPESARTAHGPADVDLAPAASNLTGALGHEDKTNPGGKPPTHPPSSTLSAHDEDLFPAPDLPPLDDLSDLLPSSWEHAEHPTSPELVVTRPPPARKRSNTKLLDKLAQPLARAVVGRPPVQEEGAGRSAVHRAPAAYENIGEGAAGRGSSAAISVDEEPLLVALAQAIRERRTGAVAAQDGAGVRRVVLTDGDVSTVISSIQNESLGHFLHERGEISAEVLASLSGTPQFGRYAGAAFIARGLLGQEELWPVLRAHSEWILCRALEHGGRAVFEAQIPPRIAEEPAVFGGAAGAEIFMEAMRRTISSDGAMARLGGPDNLLSWGRYRNLLAESALSSQEQEQVSNFMGKRAGEVQNAQPQLLPVLLALSVLGAVSPGGSGTLQTEPPPLSLRSNAMDTDAFIQRLRSRRALVDQGDYFAILGVSRSASDYEVSRARDELLRDLSEVQLGPDHQDLRPELELVRATVDEAHLVLSDEVRRVRYRRALEALPKNC